MTSFLGSNESHQNRGESRLPRKHRASYEQWEIDWLYLREGQALAYSEGDLEFAAKRFERSASAIRFVYSWVKKVKEGRINAFKYKARNRILRQIMDAHRRLG